MASGNWLAARKTNIGIQKFFFIAFVHIYRAKCIFSTGIENDLAMDGLALPEASLEIALIFLILFSRMPV